MAKLYALHPGYVRSKTNFSASHYIGTDALASLYHLRPQQYIVWDDADFVTVCGRSFEDYEHLYPRYDGEYPCLS